MIPAARARAEVVDSLRTGDHVGRVPTGRACVGLVALHLAAAARTLARRRPTATPGAPGELRLVVANPVAHGARLADAALRSAREAGIEVAVVADRRLATDTLPVDEDFPAIGVRSVVSLVDGRSLTWAWSVLAHRAAWGGGRTTSRLVHAYLVLAQSVRYHHAFARVRSAPPTVRYLVDFDRHTYTRPWSWAASVHGRGLATLVHGSPSEATYLPFVAPRVLVWGEVQAEFVRRAGAEPVVVGRPEVVAARAGSGQSTALVCHSMEDLTETEVERLGGLLTQLRAAGYDLVLKLHPRNDGEQPAGTGWSTVARWADRQLDGSTPLDAVLDQDTVVVTVTSTAAVDALAVGAAALVVSDPDRALACDLAAVRAWTRSVGDPARVAGHGVDRLRASLVAASGPEASALLGRALRDLVDGPVASATAR